MTDRTDDWPVLNDEFADRFCELQRELAQLRDQPRPDPVRLPGPDEKTLAELAELREKWQQENQRAIVAEQAAQKSRESYEAAAARVEELLARIRTLEAERPEQGTTELPPTRDGDDLRQQLIDLKEQRQRWKRLYEECRDELNGNS